MRSARNITGEAAALEVPRGNALAGSGVPAALPHRRLIFGVVAFALMMVSIDQTIVATALRTIDNELHAGLEWSGWTITAYSLGQIVVMPIAGKISDLYGRKQVFIVAIIVFTVASLLCGLSMSIAVLVPLRALQAIGGGAIIPSATGIVAEHFGPNRDRAIGMFSSVFPIGGAVGPVLGGLFVGAGVWRFIFLINVPVGILVVILSVILIPRLGRRPAQRPDIAGIALLTATLLAAMLALTSIGSVDLTPWDWRLLVPTGAAILAAAGFLLRMRRSATPFIPLSMLVGHGFGVMNVTNLIFGAAVVGFSALVPLYAQDRFGIAALPSGTLLTARAIGMICVAGIATMLLRRTGYRPPMIAGFLVAAVGVLGMALVPGGVTPYLWLSIAGGVIGIGQGVALPASNNAIMQLAPANISAIAGLRGMFRQIGSIIAVSIGTAMTARSHDPGLTMAILFVALAGSLILVTPLVLLVPEHRGRW